MKITVLSFQALEGSTGTIHRQPVPEKIGVPRIMERGAGHDTSQVQHTVPRTFLDVLVMLVHISAMKSKNTQVKSLHPREAQQM